MKKVLFIAPQPFFEWRGSPIRVSFNVRALTEVGFQVDLLVLPVGMDIEPLPNLRVLRVPNLFRIRRIAIGPSFWKAVYDIIFMCHATALMIRNRYDVLHCVEDAGIIGSILGFLSRARFVFERHSDPRSYRAGFWRNLILWIYSGMEWISIKAAHAVICTGQGLADQVRRIAPHKAVHHIFDIPSSLAEPDLQRVAQVRATLCQADGEQLVTYVGSFAVYQGIDLLFESIPATLADCPQTRFVIIGGSDREIAERKAAMTARGAIDQVSFIGKVPPDDLPDVLAASDVLLSPRLAGANTPLKILDYMKSGRAILATDTEANRLMLNADRALLVKPNAKAMAEGLKKLLQDKSLREKLAAEGLMLVRETFNYTTFKHKLEVCYQGLFGCGEGKDSGGRGEEHGATND